MREKDVATDTRIRDLVARLKVAQTGLAKGDGLVFGDAALLDPLGREARTSSPSDRRPATEAAIAAAESRLGRPLPDGFRAFLRITNGWCGLYGDDELFPVEALGDKGIADPFAVVENFASMCADKDLKDAGLVVGGGSDAVFLLMPDGRAVRFSYRYDPETYSDFAGLLSHATETAERLLARR